MQRSEPGALPRRRQAKNSGVERPTTHRVRRPVSTTTSSTVRVGQADRAAGRRGLDPALRAVEASAVAEERLTGIYERQK